MVLFIQIISNPFWMEAWSINDKVTVSFSNSTLCLFLEWLCILPFSYFCSILVHFPGLSHLFSWFQKPMKIKSIPSLNMKGIAISAVRLALPSSFPGNYTQHLIIKPPQPWTVSVSSCALSQFTLCIPAFTIMLMLFGFMCYVVWFNRLFLGPETLENVSI